MKELICHLDTRGMANMFILHDGVRHIVSFLAVRSDTTTSMVGARSKATRSLQTFQASTTATHLFLRPPKGQNETLLGATDDYCVSSFRERAWQFLRATVAAKFPEYVARFSQDKWKSEPDLKIARCSHSSCSLGDRVFVFGGYHDDGYDAVG